MAKIQENSILVPFAWVYWRKSNNMRTNYEDTKAICDSLAERGWLRHYNVPVYDIPREDKKTPDGTVIEESDFNACMKERSTRWSYLLEAAKSNPESAVELSVFERLFVKGGKLIEPRYSGNAGFRRASVFEKAMLQRFKHVPDTERGEEEVAPEEKIQDHIPVIVRNYADEADRIVDQQLENELKNVGTVEIDLADKLRIAKRLFDLGKREIFIRKLYSSSTGQKLFGLCTANMHWPELDIYNRCFLPENDPRQIMLKRVRHEPLIKMNNRYDADEKRAKGEELKGKEREYLPITADEVNRYFTDLRNKDTDNEPKIMKRPEIEAVSKQNVVDLFRVAFGAVMANNLDSLLLYVDGVNAQALNLHKKLIDFRKGSLTYDALKLVDTQPDVVSAVSAAVAKGVDVVALLKKASAVNGPAPAPVPAKVS